MAAFCLAADLDDLEARLARMVVGATRDKTPITAAALQAPGAMTVLLKDALQPNLVQSLEGTPAFVHGGPFANIAHGCNSLVATRAALKLADIVVTEAGFGADLGAEKFFDIKCRLGGLAPDAAVIVATVRALKMHGGVEKSALGHEDLAALKKGVANLKRHIENVGKFGVPVVVGLNRFSSDTPAELDLVISEARALGVEAFVCDHWARGGAGAEDLARAVDRLAHSGRAAFKPLYPDALPLVEKLRTLAREIYRADDIRLEAAQAAQFADLESRGFGHLPICVAKTQYSFSADPKLMGAPTGYVMPVKSVSLARRRRLRRRRHGRHLKHARPAPEPRGRADQAEEWPRGGAVLTVRPPSPAKLGKERGVTQLSSHPCARALASGAP